MEYRSIGGSNPLSVVIYTDGACSGNPGPGGWGALLQYGDNEKSLQGFSPHTTNNRMELLAAIHALEALKRPCPVELFTDSSYVQKGMTSWIHNWKRRNWKKKGGGRVENSDLWQRLDAINRRHEVTWSWIKGHAGHPGNEEADRLATSAIEMGLADEIPVDPAGAPLSGPPPTETANGGGAVESPSNY